MVNGASRGISGASMYKDVLNKFGYKPHEVMSANGEFESELVYGYANVLEYDNFYFDEHFLRFHVGDAGIIMGITISSVDFN